MVLQRPPKLFVCALVLALSVLAIGQGHAAGKPPRSPWTKAYKLLLADEPEDAAEAAGQVLKALPDSALGNLILAMALAGDGEQDKAMQLMNKSLAGDPAGEAQFFYERAALLADLGQSNQAARLAALGLKLSPDHAGLLAGRAEALLTKGKNLAEAEKLATKATRSAPNSPEAWELLGQIQQKRGQHAQAVLSLHRALRLDPPDKSRIEEMLLESMAKLSPDNVKRLTK